MNVKRTLAALVVGLASLALFASSTLAASQCATCQPWWYLDTNVRPATIPTGGEGSLVIRASNLGNAPTSAPITLTATLPTGTTAGKVSFHAFFLRAGNENLAGVSGVCKATARSASCSTARLEELGTLPPAMQPYEYLEMRVQVKDAGAGAGAEYEAAVNGGGATSLSRRRPLPIGESAPAFGAEEYSLVPEEEGG